MNDRVHVLSGFNIRTDPTNRQNRVRNSTALILNDTSSVCRTMVHELGETSFVANHVNARRSRISPMDNLNHRLVLGLDIVPMMLLM